MKSIFKTFFFITCLTLSHNTIAREVILLENLATQAEGEMVIKIIQEKFKIPRKLITYRNINSECSKESDSIMQLCLKSNGDLEVLKVNKFAVENSLRVFLEMENE
ncbi:MAG: hypothetical protein K2Q18_17395 [Bdellovibrionales bacterium]|nr:hypothetical protein [Bdellovibrionales bacterium]